MKLQEFMRTCGLKGGPRAAAEETKTSSTWPHISQPAPAQVCATLALCNSLQHGAPFGRISFERGGRAGLSSSRLALQRSSRPSPGRKTATKKHVVYVVNFGVQIACLDYSPGGKVECQAFHVTFTLPAVTDGGREAGAITTYGRPLWLTANRSRPMG